MWLNLHLPTPLYLMRLSNRFRSVFGRNKWLKLVHQRYLSGASQYFLETIPKSARGKSRISEPVLLLRGSATDPTFRHAPNSTRPEEPVHQLRTGKPGTHQFRALDNSFNGATFRHTRTLTVHFDPKSGPFWCQNRAKWYPVGTFRCLQKVAQIGSECVLCVISRTPNEVRNAMRTELCEVYIYY